MPFIYSHVKQYYKHFGCRKKYTKKYIYHILEVETNFLKQLWKCLSDNCRFLIMIDSIVLFFTVAVAAALAQPEYTTPGGILETNCHKGCTEVAVHESNCCKYSILCHSMLYNKNLKPAV